MALRSRCGTGLGWTCSRKIMSARGRSRHRHDRARPCGLAGCPITSPIQAYIDLRGFKPDEASHHRHCNPCPFLSPYCTSLRSLWFCILIEIQSPIIFACVLRVMPSAKTGSTNSPVRSIMLSLSCMHHQTESELGSACSQSVCSI